MRPPGDHGDHQVSLPGRLRGNERLEAEPFDGPQNGFHLAVRQRPFYGKGPFREDRLPSQYPSQRLDLLFRPIGEVGERPLLYPCTFPPGFSQKNRGPTTPVGHPFNMHDHYNTIYYPSMSIYIYTVHDYIWHANCYYLSMTMREYAVSGVELRTKAAIGKSGLVWPH